MELDNNLIKLYEIWSTNKNINPQTGRKIKCTSKIYKKYMNMNINELYLFESINDIDPISRNIFWIQEDNKKKIVYENLNNLIFYKDKNNKIRCFEKESVEFMKGYNIYHDPVTREELPQNIFNDILPNTVINEQDKTIDNIALDVFQLFTSISIFIDHKLFIKLEKNKLIKLYYEFSDFYIKNFTVEQRNIISNDVFKLSSVELNNYETDYIQKYILENMKILLNCSIEEYKFMINYILIAGLGLVIPAIAELYPQFSFTF